MARQLAATAFQRDEMVRMADAGASAMRIGRAMGMSAETVMNTVRRIRPAAFYRSSRTLPAMGPAAGVTVRRMPHQISWSTDPVSHHAISLPRLRCLESA